MTMTREQEIEFIKKNVLIEDLLNQAGIYYRKHGKYLRLYSLKNAEKEPSLLIDTKKNAFFDNSARESGSVIDFYMYAFNVDYVTAMKELRAIAGLTNNKEIKIKRKVKYNDFNKAKQEFMELMHLYIMNCKNKTKHLKEIREFIKRKKEEIFNDE